MEQMEIAMIPLQKNYCIGRKGLAEDAVSPDREMYELYCDKFDKNQFESALEKLYSKHPMLLARFDRDRELQLVDLKTKIPVIYTQMDGDYENSKAERERIMLSIFESASMSGTALQKINVLHYTDGSASVITLTDGLGMDGESQEIVIRDLGLLYQGKEIGEACDYKDFFKFLEEGKSKEEEIEDRKYWQSVISDNIQGYYLNNSFDNSGDKGTRVVVQRISKEHWKCLEQVAGKNFLSLYSLLFAVYLRLLDRYSNMDKFLVSMPISIRSYELDNIENTVGMLTDFVPFPYEARVESLLDTATRIQEQLWEVQDHNSMSGGDILRLAQSKQKQQLKLNWSFTAVMPSEKKEESPFVRKSVRVETGSLDVETLILPDEEGMSLMMTYRAGCIDGEMIHKLAAHFAELLSDLAADESKVEIKEIPLFSKDKKIIDSVNETEDSLESVSLLKLVQDSMDKYSKETALITEEKTFTYKDLNEIALKVAGKLSCLKGEEKEYRIGIFMEKGVEQIIVALAAIYTKIAYMPIETTLPAEDINWCIKQADISLIITEEALNGQTKEIMCEVKNYNELLAVESRELDFADNADEVAIIINTSGTTGHPKSVLIKQSGLVNCFVHSKERFLLEGEKYLRAIAVTNFCHDMALYDYLGMFVIGGSVVMPDYSRVKNPKYLVHLIQRYNVTFWNSVPAIMEMLLMVEDSEISNVLKSLRRIVLGGDWIRTDTVSKIWRYSPEALIYSVGGPTETTIWNISHKVSKADIDRGYIPYGKPFPNTKYHLLDKKHRKCPIGILGTMYIEGVGVAKCYAGNEEETKKHFRLISGKYMYESGDRGMHLSDGSIRFMGRVDTQVKINGKRIELGGIERKVNEISVISTNCCVVHKESGHIALFYEGNINEAEVREVLKDKLVSYMLPSFIKKLDSLPLTYNGKPDRKNLALYEFNEQKETKEDSCDSYEGKVLQILGDVLKIDSVSLEDNYYYLGGDSVTAMQFISKLYHEMKVELEVYDILGRPDIADWMPLIKARLDALATKDDKTVNLLNICREFFGNSQITVDMSFDEMGGDEEAAGRLGEKIGLTEFQLLSLPWIDCWEKLLVKE